MADSGQDNANKTEEPTEKKKREERQEGNVLKSEEVNSVILLLGGCLFLAVAAPWLKEIFSQVFAKITIIDCTHTWTAKEFEMAVYRAIAIVAPVVGASFGVFATMGAIACWSQTGPFLEIKPLKPKLSHLSPAKGVKQILPTPKNMLKLVLTITKIVIIVGLMYLAVRGEIKTLVILPLQTSVGKSVAWFLKFAVLIVVKILLVFVVVAIIDLIYRWKERHDKMMMSKQEVDDEHRNTEGDPQVKKQQKQKMQEMSLSRLVSEVGESDVVLSNPTHVAVALRYSVGDHAPRVMAKGLRKKALRIKDIAREQGVPIVEEPALARGLYRHTKLGGYITSRYFKAVAMVLARLQREGIRDFSKAAQQSN